MQRSCSNYANSLWGFSGRSAYLALIPFFSRALSRGVAGLAPVIIYGLDPGLAVWHETH